MKWTTEQTERLTEMCLAGVSNADMAKNLDIPLTEIHHKRSQLGLTIAKVKAINGADATSKVKTKSAAPKKPTPAPASPTMTPVEPPIIGKALETFNNAGELCIVLARHEETVLIVMPNKRIAAFCVPLQHRAGETSWWQGHYFDSLDDAYEYYCERVIADEQQS